MCIRDRGRILETHYNTKEKVSALIDGGDMSTCWDEEKQPEYYSARGEDCPPVLSPNIGHFFAIGEEYSYIFRNGEWICYNMNEFDDRKGPEIVAIPEGALAC